MMVTVRMVGVGNGRWIGSDHVAELPPPPGERLDQVAAVDLLVVLERLGADPGGGPQGLAASDVAAEALVPVVAQRVVELAPVLGHEAVAGPVDAQHESKLYDAL